MPQQFLETGETSTLPQACSVFHGHWTEFTALTPLSCLSLVKKKPETWPVCVYGKCLAHRFVSTGKIKLLHLLFGFFPSLGLQEVLGNDVWCYCAEMCFTKRVAF